LIVCRIRNLAEVAVRASSPPRTRRLDPLLRIGGLIDRISSLHGFSTGKVKRTLVLVDITVVPRRPEDPGIADGDSERASTEVREKYQASTVLFN
jgi:hypothetical protein